MTLGRDDSPFLIEKAATEAQVIQAELPGGSGIFGQTQYPNSLLTIR